MEYLGNCDFCGVFLCKGSSFEFQFNLESIAHCDISLKISVINYDISTISFHPFLFKQGM